MSIVGAKFEVSQICTAANFGIFQPGPEFPMFLCVNWSNMQPRNGLSFNRTLSKYVDLTYIRQCTARFMGICLFLTVTATKKIVIMCQVS